MKKKSTRKKKLSKDMSINDLAVMVQGGFAEMDKRFLDLENKMDKRFVTIEKRLDFIDRRLDIIENKLIAKHDKEIDHLRDRLLRIETKLAKIS